MKEIEQVYYVCHRDLGVSRYDTSNDAMICICASKEEDEWIKFSWQEAQEVRATTGWKICKAFSTEDEY